MKPIRFLLPADGTFRLGVRAIQRAKVIPWLVRGKAAWTEPMQISLRVTSMGNALMHEMKMAGRPDDPITMLYIDGDRLFLTHYCDAGNRPRMAATITLDGKTVDFHFLDVANFNGKQGGYNATRSVPHPRCQPPHRGLDLPGAGKADQRTPQPAANEMTGACLWQGTFGKRNGS